MDYWDKKLLRKQISKKIEPLKSFAQASSSVGSWVKTIRQALGMTTYDLAGRAGMDQAQLSRIEKAEPEGKVTLATMQKIAGGLDMKFVYGFVSDDDLEALVYRQAKKIALKRLNRLDKTMALELQQLDPHEKKEALSDLIDKILADSPPNFWEE
jgi:predicted DNA-binding mobile mystery protein A